MNAIIHLTPKQLRQAASLKEKIAAFQKQLAKLVASNDEGGNSALLKVARKKRKMSAAGRARIAAAARARWAKVRAGKKK